MNPHDPTVTEILRQWRELPLGKGPSLRELCGGNEALYKRVLAALEEDRTRLAADSQRTITIQPPVDIDAPTATTNCHGQDWTESEIHRPEILGYDILGYLGRGGWGVVYRAMDLRLNREVALKLLTPAGVYHPEVRERFTRESRALAKLEHPNVIPIYDAGDAFGLPYFTMKFVAGGTLAAAATRIGRSITPTVRLMARVARAVQYLHERGIVHRDLKPANILLGPGDEPLVADFGMVKWLDDDHELTLPGAILGTRLYMAPEQSTGELVSIGPQADIWSLGVILYELLAGCRPFDHRDAVELVRIVREEPPPSLKVLRPDVPSAVLSIITRCLDKSPAKRYPSAAAIADDLESWSQTGRLADPETTHRRALPIRRIIALTCLSTVGGLLLATTPRPSNPLDNARRVSIAELIQQNDDVVLIGAKGLPTSKLIINDGFGLLNTDGEGYATLHGPNYLAVELSDEPLPPRFELAAEVSPEPGEPPSADFGVYAGRRQWPCPGGHIHRMVYAGVNGRLNNTVRGTLGVVWLEPNQEPNSPPLALGPPIEDKQPPNMLAPRKWYAVSLRIAPDKPPQASCQGVVFEANQHRNRSPSIWTQILSPRGRSNPLAADQPLLGSGVGIYVLNGTARFRNVQVKPLQQLTP